jgi:hypothetical protein
MIVTDRQMGRFGEPIPDWIGGGEMVTQPPPPTTSWWDSISTKDVLGVLNTGLNVVGSALRPGTTPAGGGNTGIAGGLRPQTQFPGGAQPYYPTQQRQGTSMTPYLIGGGILAVGVLALVLMKK